MVARARPETERKELCAFVLDRWRFLPGSTPFGVEWGCVGVVGTAMVLSSTTCFNAVNTRRRRVGFVCTL